MKKLSIIISITLLSHLASAQQVIKAGKNHATITKADSTAIMAGTHNTSVRQVIANKLSIANCETADYILAMVQVIRKSTIKNNSYAKK
jgi:hypothetical protein